MQEALTEAPEGPQTDTLGEQVEIPKAQENLMPVEDTPEEKLKPEVKKSAEEKRSDSVKNAIDKALADDKDEKKADPKAEKLKADEKAAARAEKDAKRDIDLDAQRTAETDAPDGDDEDAAPATAEKKPSAYKEPPKGFDDAAKAEWEATPESVRGAVNRRLQEMERGIHKHQQTAQEFEPVRKFAEMAKQSGTTLDQALNRYVGMEQQLRQNPIQGLQAVVANLGLKKSDGSPVTLRDVAANIMGQSPDKVASQQEAVISQLSQQVQNLTQQLGGFSEHVEQQKTQERTTAVESEWTEFQRTNERAKELEPQIAEFLTKYPAEGMSVGERLQDAYDWAVSRNPSVAHTDPPPLAQTQPKPRQANPAGQKSISGAPGGNDAKSSGRKLSRKESIEKAMRLAGI